MPLSSDDLVNRVQYILDPVTGEPVPYEKKLWRAGIAALREQDISTLQSLLDAINMSRQWMIVWMDPTNCNSTLHLAKQIFLRKNVHIWISSGGYICEHPLKERVGRSATPTELEYAYRF